MSARDLATRLAVLTALEERVGKAKAACRKRLDEQLHKDASKGSYVLLGEEQLGEVSRVKGSTSVRVQDPQAFLAWVREHYPTEVESVEQVRPAFQAKVLDSAKAHGVPVDPQGTFVPGITVTTGNPTLRYTPSKDATAAVERAWQAGAIDLRDVLALPGGES